VDVWSTGLALLLKLVSFFLDRSSAKDATKQKFYDFIDSTRNDALISVQAHDVFRKQRQQLLDGMAKPEQP
jgi:hypothetical protein